jgi:hypothetical protein
MLIFVPLLAGTWPAMRAIINSYNKILEESTTKLSDVMIELEKNANSVRTIIPDSRTTASESAIQGLVVTFMPKVPI